MRGRPTRRGQRVVVGHMKVVDHLMKGGGGGVHEAAIVGWLIAQLRCDGSEPAAVGQHATWPSGWVHLSAPIPTCSVCLLASLAPPLAAGG